MARGVVAILPVGSTEAHGPHLPLATDVIISEEMSRRAALKLAEQGIETLVLPAIAYSVTDFSRDFSGSISIRRETAAAVIRDICVSLYDQGARLVVIANSHLEPEHIASITDAVEQVKQQTGRQVAFPDKRRRRWAATLTEEFRRGDCHAGSYETSLVLAARPDLVRDQIREALDASADLYRRKDSRRRYDISRGGRRARLFRRPARGLARGRRGFIRGAFGYDSRGGD